MTRFASTTAAAFAAIAAAWLLAGAAGALAQQPAQGQASVEQRLDRIEEQLLDLNSMIGTLQSLASNSGAVATAPQPGGAAPMVPPQPATPAAGAVPADVDQRIQAIETQIGALANQMERITGEISQIQAALAGSGQPVSPGGSPQPAPQQQGALQQPVPQQPAVPGQTASLPQQQTFGTLNVEPEQQPHTQQQPAPAQQQSPATVAAAPPEAAAGPTAQSQAEYDAAFRLLVQRDFKAAEEGFRTFLEAHPDDPLAGNAQYWLGETYYVRGLFREAANSFLTGYRKYRNSDKAPANLLKLGMSLSQLGQKDDACATFSELANRYPRAPSHLKQRAASERERTGC
jgi:tol-pal system protein YbgF